MREEVDGCSSVSSRDRFLLPDPSVSRIDDVLNDVLLPTTTSLPSRMKAGSRFRAREGTSDPNHVFSRLRGRRRLREDVGSCKFGAVFSGGETGAIGRLGADWAGVGCEDDACCEDDPATIVGCADDGVDGERAGMMDRRVDAAEGTGSEAREGDWSRVDEGIA